MICLSLMESSIESNLDVLEKNSPYIDIVELRLDMLDDPMIVSPGLVRFKLLFPVIITFRRKIDGGNYEGSEQYRREVLCAFSKHSFNYIDLEFDTNFPEIENEAILRGIKIIRSYHNFENVPDNLESLIRTLASKPGEIPKVAVFPRSSAETLKLFKVFEKVKDIKEKILLGMGSFGLPTRILYNKLGSLLSFCSSSNNSAAPGHLSPEEMKTLYHVAEISSSTSIFGIIGNPVMHSLSPQLHNRAYQRASLDAVYIPFLVDDIGFFLELANLLEIKGFSVTVPHKVAILDFLDDQTSEVDAIGASNTVLREGSLWKGFNTDPAGFLKPLLSLIDISSLKNCAVIGAGGAARSVISAVKSIGLEVSIFNRSETRAAKLASETDCSYYSPDRVDLLSGYDVIVQTTSVGMTPIVNESPISGIGFRKGQIVYDIIYTPVKTRFLKEAEAAGSLIIGGMEMLNAQGIRQFEIFTGMLFPAEEQKGSF